MSRRGHFKKKQSPSSVILSPDQWPAVDRALWHQLKQPSNPLEVRGRVSHWAVRTIRNVEQSYGHWLKWLFEHDMTAIALDPIERVTRAHVRLYVEEMQKRLSPCTVQIHLQRLGQMMVAFTETKEFGWLFHAANRLRPKSVRNKRVMIQPSYRLAELGHRLMREAESMDESWHAHRSIRYRNGLMIAFLAYRPVRLANLVGIVIDQHLIRTSDGYTLAFAAHETKQREVLEFELPKILVESLSQYLCDHRSALLNLGSNARTANNRLWVSRDGGSLEAAGASTLIKAETKAAFGRSVNPHLFRDCAATTIAIDDPEHAYVIAAILGHSSMATSERHYNQSSSLEAGRQFHATLSKIRTNLGSKIHMQRSGSRDQKTTWVCRQ